MSKLNATPSPLTPYKNSEDPPAGVYKACTLV